MNPKTKKQPQKIIRSCISSPSVSVFINGSPSSPFLIQKSLLQGDPLSPFLFILVAEGLSLLLKNLSLLTYLMALQLVRRTCKSLIRNLRMTL